LGAPKTLEELLVRECVAEGHAQFITRRIAHGLDLKNTFELLQGNAARAVLLAAPRRMRDLSIEIAREVARLRYDEGEKFFAACVERFGYAEAERHVFGAPPTRLRQIVRPGEYFGDCRLKPDYLDVVDELLRQVNSPVFRLRTLPFLAIQLRTFLSKFARARRREYLDAYQGGVAVTVEARDPRIRSTLAVVLVQFGTEETAREYLKEVVEVRRRRADRDQGGLRKEPSTGVAFKTVLIGEEQAVFSRWAIKHGISGYECTALDAVAGTFVLHLSGSRVDEGEDVLRRVALRVLNVLGAAAFPEEDPVRGALEASDGTSSLEGLLTHSQWGVRARAAGAVASITNGQTRRTATRCSCRRRMSIGKYEGMR
jgi:hypothetical protein